MHTAAIENKMLDAHAALENKQDKGLRVPTGQIDAELRVRVNRDGVLPVLDIRTFRRSPAEVSADAFHPTAGGVTLDLQYADLLLEAIAKVGAA